MNDVTPAAVHTVSAGLPGLKTRREGGHLLSSQGRAVLQALAAAPDGQLPTADVRRRV
jgi:hypothetical protein